MATEDQTQDVATERAVADQRDNAAQAEDLATAINDELTKARKAADMAFKARQAAESAQREAEHKLKIAEAAEARMNEALKRMNDIENFMTEKLCSSVPEPTAGMDGADGGAGESGAAGAAGTAGAEGSGADGQAGEAGQAGGAYGSADARAAGQAGAAQHGGGGVDPSVLAAIAPMLMGRPADEIVSSMGQLSTLLIGTSPAFASAMRAQTDAIASGMAGLNSVSNQQSHYTLDLAATARAVSETYAERVATFIPRPPPASES